MVLKPMMSVGTTTVASGYRQGGRPPSLGSLFDEGPSRGRADDRGGGASGPALPHPQDGQAGAARRHSLLARTVVSEVVPRLVLAHRDAAAQPAPAAAARARVLKREVAAFTELLLDGDVPRAEAVVAALRSRGATLEQVCLELMTPAARRMGDAWLEDTRDYTDVTLGMWRMHGILRGMDAVFQPQADTPQGVPRRALITAVPGATHVFGGDMVAGFLRLAGWEVCNEAVESGEELAALVRRGRFAVIGLSAGCTADLRALAELIGLVRRASGRQRPVGIMVGGSIVECQQRQVLRIGADAVAVDAPHAVQQAEALLALLVS